VNLWESNFGAEARGAVLSDADAYFSCSLEVRSHSQTSKEASAQRGSINDEFFILKQKFYKPSQWPQCPLYLNMHPQALVDDLQWTKEDRQRSPKKRGLKALRIDFAPVNTMRTRDGMSTMTKPPRKIKMRLMQPVAMNYLRV
jgi:hypothetical protein